MIGMGYFSENNYFVDQLILPDLADEKAFLHQIEITFARFPVLLTYNGKGFDIPMIQSRINFHLFPDFTKDIRHIDLLMIARKYWKKNLGSVKLSNIEQFLLQLKRGEEEVPGFMAPELYREYLRTMDSRNLTGVAYHNQIDVISLSAFLIYLNNLCTEGLKDPSIWEKNNVFINNLLLHNLPVFASGEAGESTELLNAQPFSKKECLKLARKYSIEKHYQKAVKIYNDYANFDAECCYFAADILGNKMFDYNSAVSFLQHGLELIENNDAIAKWSKKAQIERFISVMTKFSEQARLSQKE